jgi:nitroimidazol reductase NimA-like FMN-containing flavoprotein (pyridoxamine 5'-phosphate oxidase superfamily)
MDELSRVISEYIGHCRSCTIATVGSDGEPDASTVFFASSGLDVYFNTAKDSKKIRNIEMNQRVAIVMQKNPDPKTDKEISGIQYSGIAKMLKEDEQANVPRSVIARHNVFNSVRPGNSVIVKVSATKVYLIDYAKGFRHRELLQLL